MDKEEIVKLRAHLRRSLGAPGLNVVPDSRNKESAAVQLGERKIGTLLADEEDGDRSFFFEMNVPVERPALQDYLRKLFENDKLTIAARTSRVRVGVLIAALARRRPWKFAREMATLDVLSEGRLIVGVGLGSQPQEEFAAFGEDPDPRRRHELVDEGLDIVCGLWTGQPFSYEGQHYRVAESLFLPSPIQRPPVQFQRPTSGSRS